MSNLSKIKNTEGKNWAEKVENFKKSPEQQYYRNKIRGSLLGGAAGDALGYAVEFMRLREIRKKFGDKGITSYELNKDGKATVSDDTQMTLFTANGLLLGHTRGVTRGFGMAAYDYVIFAYQDWLATQAGRKQYLGGSDDNYPPKNTKKTWLYNIPELHNRRAPGMTCLSALSSGRKGSVNEPINNSKGCGGVMRVAPMGLFCVFAKDPRTVIEGGAEIAAITHGHELGWLPAAFLAELIRNIVYDTHIDGHGLKECIESTIELLEEIYGSTEHRKNWNVLKKLLITAIDYAENDRTDEENIRNLGEGWVAEEALVVALYCALKYSDNFSDCIISAVNHDGDSDSTGSIAGNILGAWLGMDLIEQKWLGNLEMRDIILEIADDLCDGCPMYETLQYEDKVWSDKYLDYIYAGKEKA